MEGNLIQAIINIQLKTYLKQFLPKFEQRFSNDLRHMSVFDCYGIHSQVPQIRYFQGGFAIVGNYKKVPIVNAACLQVETGAHEAIMNYLTPKMWRSKFEILMRIYQKLNGDNVDIKDVIQEVLKNSQGLTSSLPIGNLDLDSLSKSAEPISKFIMEA